MSAELNDFLLAEYADVRDLPNGRNLAYKRLMFHWALYVDLDEVGYGDRYCYATLDGVRHAFLTWNGDGDPEGWHRHPKTGRRRDLATGKEWIAF
jgi:hypothetical protein